MAPAASVAMRPMWALVVLVSLACLAGPAAAAGKLQVVNAWKSLDFAFQSEPMRQKMIRDRSFIPGNSIPIDVQPWQDERGTWKILMTIPRFNKGVPATLVSVPSKGGMATPLIPFPDWEANREGNCNGITSVFRVQVDSCGRLWVLDSGTVDIMTEFRRVCSPQVVVFGRRGDVVRRYAFPDDVLTPGSLLATIATESRDQQCRDTFAYAADVTGFGLVVFDERKGHSWRVTSNYFYPYPTWGRFDVNGDAFDLMDGLLGLALGPPQADGDRNLYFHPFASNVEGVVRTSVLRNQSQANADRFAFRVFDQTRPGQVAPEAVDVDGIMYFSVVPDNTLICWNTRQPYGGSNLNELDRDVERLQFASGIKVVRDSKGQSHLWVLTDRFQKQMTGSLDSSQVNFRILSAPTAPLVRGTSCAVRSQPLQQSNYGGPSGGYYGGGGSLIFQ